MERTQTATLADNLPSNGRNLSSEKELVRAYSTLALAESGELHEVVVARCWMARRSDGASPVYAAVWLHGGGRYGSGRGIARGYGYHKASAAIAGAFDSAGVKLAQPIDGVGDQAIRDAMEATARAMGYVGALLTVEHA